MIIIPTYNERKNIESLVSRIRSVLPRLPILFVDDNSEDGTGEEIKKIQTSDTNIHLLSRPHKRGFASAYLDGINFVLQNFSPSFIVTMDADLSHPPEKLPELISIANQGKIAVGSRYVEGGQIKNWSWRRRLLSKLGNIYARLLTNLPIQDVTSGFLAIPISKIQKLDLPSIRNRGYAFLIELKLRLAQQQSEFVGIPITFEERKEGVSKLGRSIVIEGIKYPAKIFWQRQIDNYPAWLIFFISLIAYVWTLPRAIFFGDSPEFMASAATLGIPHPPGYPAYVLIAKLFTYLPVSTLEFRIGLFSALSASLCLVVFYFLFLRISNNKYAAVLATLILGSSSLFWSQAIMAKVYMQLLLIVVTILLLCLKYWTTGESKYMVWTAFLFGLGVGFHQMILLFLPLWAFVVIFPLFKMSNPFSYQFRLKPVLISILLFLLGASTYLFLPVREHMAGNFYDFSKIFRASQPGTLQGFLNYFLRKDYADYSGAFVFRDKLNFFTSFLAQIWGQFSILLVLAVLGLIKFWISGKKYLVLTLGVLLLNFFGIILLRSSKWNFENEFLSSFYFLPAMAMVALWIGIGFAMLPIKRKLLWVLLIFPVLLGYKNFPQQNLSHFKFLNAYSAEVLQSLPPNAVLLANYPGGNTDTVLFALHYQQLVNHLRSDVSVLTTSDIYPNVDRRVLGAVFGLEDPKLARYYLLTYTLKTQQYQNRPIFTTYLTDDLSDKKPDWTEVSNGLVYQFYDKPRDLKPLENHELAYQKDLTILTADLFGQDLISQYLYSQAAYWAGQNNRNLAQKNFIEAIKYDYKVQGLDQTAFINYRAKVLKP